MTVGATAAKRRWPWAVAVIDVVALILGQATLPTDSDGGAFVLFVTAIASFAGDAGLADRRSKRLWALLDTAVRRSPLYARLLKGADLSKLRALRVISRTSAARLSPARAKRSPS